MTPLMRVGVRLLRRLAAERSLNVTIDVLGERPWASALFVGTRLTIAVESADDERLDEWLIALPDMDLPLSGHFVASAELVERRANAATIELLLIEG
ncbi:hypothetical protein [Sphingomonas bacterium]|uniref:hypothetical protein n=1 Tax=Sphingomonas bacterium TaxID=1895847 RepID=UPI00262FB4AF|nr:hypothetical protein [Sphingomonas bacterium]MDB5677238.1 hypothetical protein [Sphingomonas bacterium]